MIEFYDVFLFFASDEKEDWMNGFDVSVLLGPILGAVIGYFTNLIAVKMLFFPKKEVKIGSFVLPFTPGAIPKGQARLARGIANTVSKNLITKEDISEKLLNEETKSKMLGEIKKFMEQPIKADIMLASGNEEEYEKLRSGVKEHMLSSLMRAVREMQLGEVISGETKRVLVEKTSGKFYSFLVNETTLKSISEPILTETDRFIETKIPTMLENEIENRISKMEGESLMDFIQKSNYGEEKIWETIRKLYEDSIRSGVDNFMKDIDVYQMVESKINGMDVNEMETLVLQIMKKELDSIVNLGAIIGFLLGCLNLLH